MTLYVRYDNTAKETTQVLGWYDTGLHEYSSMPPEESLLEVTREQWDQHLVPHQHFGVRPGKTPVLVPFDPPVTSVGTSYDRAIAAGAAVAVPAHPELNGLYGLDQAALASELQFIASFGEFSSDGAATLAWPLLGGGEVTFSSTEQFLAVAKALLRYITGVRAACAAEAYGGKAEFPDPNLSVS